jgi:uncharacterized membrane protein
MNRLFLLLSSCLLLSFNGIAQDYYYIEDFFVDLKLDKEGVIKITELIKIHFNEPRHGIYRDLPLSYRVSDKVSGSFFDKWFPHDLFISDVEVKNFKFKDELLGVGVRLKIGDADILVDGDQLYQISYTIRNGLLHNEKNTELYWNLVGDDIEEEVKHAGFKVTIPHDIPIKSSDIDVWTGTYGQRDHNVTTQFENGVLTGETTESLGRRQALTVALRMPPGAVKAYPAYRLFIYHFKYLLIPIFMLFGFLYFWWKYGRDTRLADMVAYLPPKNMDPAMSGFAIDIKANKRDALSLIPYFGANGLLKVEHKENKGIFAEDEITFTKLKDLPSNAPPHQKIFFNGLFEGRKVVKLSSLKDSFYMTLNSTLSSISDVVMSSDYFTKQSVKLYWNSIWIFILLGVINSVYCFFSGRLIFLGLTIVITILLAWYAYILLKRSQSGDEKFKEINGFRKFIRLAEKDKLEFLVKEDPSYFDKTLPYAIAFDCADEWCKKFKGLEIPAPQWYSSNVPFYNSATGFNVSQFNHTMSSSLSDMRSVMSSTPSSSGSGSSSGGGGGFSGGGFGGGGVSSW